MDLWHPAAPRARPCGRRGLTRGTTLAAQRGMDKEKPRPEDSPEQAQAKSKSVDERIPPVIAPKDGLPGPGEQVLEQEAKATRQPQRP